MNHTELKYFRDNWRQDYSKYNYSGWKLLDQLQPTDKILDIGCGFNPFKEKLGDAVYGIDPANDKADEVTFWEDFVPKQQFNVYLCLGSLNFGPEQEVEEQVKKLSELTKKGDRVYWRQNPGSSDHPWDGVEDVRFYPWTIDKNKEWCEKYGFDLKDIKMDSGNRIYAEWIRC